MVENARAAVLVGKYLAKDPRKIEEMLLMNVARCFSWFSSCLSELPRTPDKLPDLT
jgi:hypothetical protein